MRLQKGRKETAIDSKYFRIAEEVLYGELAVALDMERDRVSQYIEEQLNKIVDRLKEKSNEEEEFFSSEDIKKELLKYEDIKDDDIVNDICQDIVDVVKKVAEHERLGIPMENVVALRKKYLESCLELLGYSSTDRVKKGEIDIKKCDLKEDYFHFTNRKNICWNIEILKFHFIASKAKLKYRFF